MLSRPKAKESRLTIYIGKSQRNVRRATWSTFSSEKRGREEPLVHGDSSNFTRHKPLMTEAEAYVKLPLDIVI